MIKTLFPVRKKQRDLGISPNMGRRCFLIHENENQSYGSNLKNANLYEKLQDTYPLPYNIAAYSIDLHIE
jgi:hypothetical protein